MKERKTLHKIQFGFRPKKSKTDAINKVLEVLRHAIKSVNSAGHTERIKFGILS